MQSGCKKGSENIYFACRIHAAETNGRLSSRESAAELLGVSPSTLANYELGVTKTVPVDSVVMMADLYHAPELKNLYCKTECPIGRSMPLATDYEDLHAVTIKLLNRLDDEEISGIKRKLLRIAEDGQIKPEEREQMNSILESLNRVTEAVSELRMLAERYSE